MSKQFSILESLKRIHEDIFDDMASETDGDKEDNTVKYDKNKYLTRKNLDEYEETVSKVLKAKYKYVSLLTRHAWGDNFSLEFLIHIPIVVNPSKKLSTLNTNITKKIESLFKVHSAGYGIRIPSVRDKIPEPPTGYTPFIVCLDGKFAEEETK